MQPVRAILSRHTQVLHFVVGSLLDVPTHTVNMTVLKSTQDLWQSYSMSTYEVSHACYLHPLLLNHYQKSTTCTLAEFLIDNEGKRCVVVLDVGNVHLCILTSDAMSTRKLRKHMMKRLYGHYSCHGSLVTVHLRQMAVMLMSKTWSG